MKVNKKKQKRKLENEINTLCEIVIHRLENNVKRGIYLKNVSREVWELATL